MTLTSILAHSLPRPLKKKLYYVKHHRRFQVEALRGVTFPLVAHSGSKLWTSRLSRTEGHEVGLCRWFQRNIRPEDIVFEVGSCFAFFPSLISTLQPEAEVHTFEPNWKLNSFVIENAKLNQGSHPWRVNEAFVCDRDDNRSHLSLDRYAQRHSSTPSIVKIDVDGPEQQVLIGSKNLIEQRRTQFLIEVHPKELPKFEGCVQGVLDQFPSDYRIRVLAEIRGSSTEWTDDLGAIREDDNPYISAAPRELFRE